MATTELKVKIDAAINAEPTLKALRELKQLQKEVVAGSDDYTKITQRMNDIKDATKTASSQSEDLVDSLAAAPGPIGMLARGYDSLTSSTNKWGLAWKATGIGLLVALVGQLVTAFTSNEKAMKKLEPIMIAFEQILGGIFKALEPVFDTMVDLATKAIPVVQNAIGGLYAGLAGLASFLKNFFVVQFKNFQAFGKVLKGVFTLDYDLIKEGVNDVVNNIKEGVKNVVDTTTKTWDNYNKGLAETTKTQKKNQQEANDAAAKALQTKKENLESEQKLLLANLEKSKAIALANTKTEEERLNVEKKFAQDSYDARRKTLEQLRSLYGKNSKEYQDYTAQLTSLDAEYIGKKSEFANKEKEIATKTFQDNVKSKQQENKLIIDGLTATYAKQKELYGENSAEARKAQDDIFAAQQKAVSDELALYEIRKQQVGSLTQDEAARVEELKGQQISLTTTIEIENSKREKSDIDSALKTAEETKKISDQKFAEKMKSAENDFALQQKILDDKIKQDEDFFKKQLANEKLTAEQRKKIEEDYTKAKQANADAQIAIDQKKFDAQQKLLQAISQILKFAADELGKTTAAGKALAVAAALIDTYGAIAAILKAAGKTAAGGIPGFAIAQSIAAGLVGFKAVQGIINTPVPSGGGGGGAPEQPRKLAYGGVVKGAGSGRSDLIPAFLSNGESVINAESTSLFKPLLSSINAIGGGRRFAEGGLAIGGFSQDQALKDLQNTLTTQTAPIKTYVVSSDMSNQQMMDRAIKTRSTL